MRKAYFILIVAAIVLVTGCVSNKDVLTPVKKGNDNNKVQDTNEVLEKTVRKDGIELYLKVNRSYYQSKDEIKVIATLTNTGEQPFTYTLGSGCDDPIGIGLLIPHYDAYPVIKNEEEKACTAALTDFTLEPGETKKEEVIFLPRMELAGNEIQLPTGKYTMKAGFNSYYTDFSLETEVDITIDGREEPLLTAEEVKEMASKHKKVKAWWGERTGESIAKKENGNYFVKETDGTWQKTYKDLYLKTLEMEPHIYTKFGEDVWIVGYVMKLGEPPHRIEVKVDATTGEILSVQTYDK